MDSFHHHDRITALAQKAMALFEPLQMDQKRDISISFEANSPVLITIASDGLSLEDKILVERLFAQTFSEESISSSWRINFKRFKPSEHHKQTKPFHAGAEKKHLPFGLVSRQKPIKGVNAVIAVASGKGGVGKSTVSTQLAITLSSMGFRVGLLDADLYGPSSAMMLGLKEGPSIEEEGLFIPAERYGVKCMSFGFMLDKKEPVMWRGPLISKALEQLCFQTNWGNLDVLLIDLPPGTGDIQLTMIETLFLTGGIIVSTPQDIALIDAHKAVSMFEKLKVPILGYIENMSHFTCSNCGHKEHIFHSNQALSDQSEINSFALERNIDLLGQIPLLTALCQAADRGQAVTFLNNPDLLLLWQSIASKVLAKGHLYQTLSS